MSLIDAEESSTLENSNRLSESLSEHSNTAGTWDGIFPLMKPDFKIVSGSKIVSLPSSGALVPWCWSRRLRKFLELVNFSLRLLKKARPYKTINKIFLSTHVA